MSPATLAVTSAATTVLRARLVCPATNRDSPGSLLIQHGRIASIGAPGEPAPEGATVIDAIAANDAERVA